MGDDPADHDRRQARMLDIVTSWGKFDGAGLGHRWTSSLVDRRNTPLQHYIRRADRTNKAISTDCLTCLYCRQCLLRHLCQPYPPTSMAHGVLPCIGLFLCYHWLRLLWRPSEERRSSYSCFRGHLSLYVQFWSVNEASSLPDKN